MWAIRLKTFGFNCCGPTLMTTPTALHGNKLEKGFTGNNGEILRV